MPMNNRTMRPKKAAAAVVTYNAEALAWKTAAEANGGTVTTSTLAAVSTFCNAIDAAGIRDRFLRLNLVCGGNLAAARTPLYRGASLTGTQYGSAADVNNGPFVSGDYSEATGLQGNGTSKCLNTGLTIGTLATFGAYYNNCHIGVYRRDTAAGPDFGGATYYNYGNACMLDTTTGWLGNYPYFHAGSGNMGEGIEVTGSTGSGFHLADGSALVYLRNGSDVTAAATSNNPFSFDSNDTLPLYAGGVYSDNEDSESSAYSSGIMAAYSVGKAFSSAGERTAFYTAMQAFQTALGRNV